MCRPTFLLTSHICGNAAWCNQRTENKSPVFTRNIDFNALSRPHLTIPELYESMTAWMEVTWVSKQYCTFDMTLLLTHTPWFIKTVSQLITFIIKWQLTSSTNQNYHSELYALCSIGFYVANVLPCHSIGTGSEEGVALCHLTQVVIILARLKANFWKLFHECQYMKHLT